MNKPVAFNYEDYLELVRQRDALRDALTFRPASQPPEESDLYLVLVTGQWGNQILEDAYELAEYYKDSGEWVLETLPEWESPPITHWLPLPAGRGETAE